MDYYSKYLKYKNKYLSLKHIKGGKGQILDEFIKQMYIENKIPVLSCDKQDNKLILKLRKTNIIINKQTDNKYTIMFEIDSKNSTVYKDTTKISNTLKYILENTFYTSDTYTIIFTLFNNIPSNIMDYTNIDKYIKEFSNDIKNDKNIEKYIKKYKNMLNKKLLNIKKEIKSYNTRITNLENKIERHPSSKATLYQEDTLKTIKLEVLPFEEEKDILNNEYIQIEKNIEIIKMHFGRIDKIKRNKNDCVCINYNIIKEFV